MKVPLATKTVHKRYEIQIVHGETHSVYNIVDSWASEDESPFIILSTRSKPYADRCVQHYNTYSSDLEVI
jgi:hypothetical protein